MACRVCMIDEPVCVQCTVSRPRETRDSLTRGTDNLPSFSLVIRQQTLFSRQGRHTEKGSLLLFSISERNEGPLISSPDEERGFHTNPPSWKTKKKSEIISRHTHPSNTPCAAVSPSTLLTLSPSPGRLTPSPHQGNTELQRPSLHHRVTSECVRDSLTAAAAAAATIPPARLCCLTHYAPPRRRETERQNKHTAELAAVNGGGGGCQVPHSTHDDAFLCHFDSDRDGNR